MIDRKRHIPQRQARYSPVPSPRCRSAVISGFLCSASSTSRAAGSTETWLANTALSAPGQRRTAQSAATLLIKAVHHAMGIFSNAPPKNTPHSPAMSNPPSAASTPQRVGSIGDG